MEFKNCLQTKKTAAHSDGCLKRGRKSALAELGGAAGGLETVLLLPLALQTLDMTAFSASLV